MSSYLELLAKIKMVLELLQFLNCFAGSGAVVLKSKCFLDNLFIENMIEDSFDESISVMLVQYWAGWKSEVQWRSQKAEKDTHQRETTRTSSDSLQLCPFSKWELLLKERICSQREQILSIKSSFLWYGKSLLPHRVTSLECYYFY